MLYSIHQSRTIFQFVLFLVRVDFGLWASSHIYNLNHFLPSPQASPGFFWFFFLCFLFHFFSLWFPFCESLRIIYYNTLILNKIESQGTNYTFDHTLCQSILDLKIKQAPVSSMTSSSCFSFRMVYIFWVGNEGQAWLISFSKQLTTFSLNFSLCKGICQPNKSPDQMMHFHVKDNSKSIST